MAETTPASPTTTTPPDPDPDPSILSIPSIPSPNLPVSGAEFRQSHLSATGKSYDKTVVGVAVLHTNVSEASPKLLLKRAAHETSYANLFELPGGKVEATDLTIKHAVVRELYEETGLVPRRILAEFEAFEYVVQRAKGVEEMSYQLNFLVEVEAEGGEGEVVVVVVNLEEHSESVWVAEGELEELPMSEGMRGVAKNAFGCARRLGERSV